MTFTKLCLFFGLSHAAPGASDKPATILADDFTKPDISAKPAYTVIYDVQATPRHVQNPAIIEGRGVDRRSRMACRWPCRRACHSDRL